MEIKFVRIFVFMLIYMVLGFLSIMGLIEFYKVMDRKIDAFGVLLLLAISFVLTFIVFIFFSMGIKQKPYLNSLILLLGMYAVSLLIRALISDDELVLELNWKLLVIQVAIVVSATYIGFKKEAQREHGS